MKEKKATGDVFGRLVEGRDYYLDSKGLCVFTREYLKERGYCCKSGCRNCPYGFKKSNLLG